MKGFTIVEILVVLAITALLSGIILTYTSTGRAQVALSIEEAKLSQVILRAKSLAISTYNNNVSDVPCGYGVHIDYAARTYAMFSYDPRSPFDPGATCSGITQIDTNNADAYKQIGELFPLANELQLDDTQPDRLDTVFFRPPNPQTSISSPASPDFITSGLGRVYLSTKNNSFQAVIEVTLAGQVNTSH